MAGTTRDYGVGFVTIEAIGTRKLLKKLDAMPVRIRTRIVKKAVSRVTTVMKRELVMRVPEGTEKPKGVEGKDEKPRKRLKKSIIKSTRVRKGGKVMIGLVGVPSYYPRFVYMLHHGIAPHVIEAKNGRSMSFAGGRYSSVNHPGVRAMSFMDDALAASIPKARSAMARALRTSLASVTR
jgi:hypothetical protein